MIVASISPETMLTIPMACVCIAIAAVSRVTVETVGSIVKFILAPDGKLTPLGERTVKAVMTAVSMLMLGLNALAWVILITLWVNA